MMEWGDIGIKDVDDVLRVLRAGAKARELLASYGARIAGLLAHALDQLVEERKAERRPYAVPMDLPRSFTDPAVEEMIAKGERPWGFLTDAQIRELAAYLDQHPKGTCDTCGAPRVWCGFVDGVPKIACGAHVPPPTGGAP